MALSDRAASALRNALKDYGAASEIQSVLDTLNALTAAETAFVHGAVAGTQAAGKAIVNDANVNQGAVKATALSIGVSGSETLLTATIAEINQHCDESANTEIVIATNVITASESGKTFFLNAATEFVSTLPAPALGLRYTFIVSAAPSGASYTIVTATSANIILGHILSSQDAGGSGDSETTGGDTISFVDGQAVVGDRVDVISDGTNWFVRASCKVVAGITITTAS